MKEADFGNIYGKDPESDSWTVFQLGDFLISQGKTGIIVLQKDNYPPRGLQISIGSQGPLIQYTFACAPVFHYLPDTGLLKIPGAEGIKLQSCTEEGFTEEGFKKIGRAIVKIHNEGVFSLAVNMMRVLKSSFVPEFAFFGHRFGDAHKYLPPSEVLAFLQEDPNLDDDLKKIFKYILYPYAIVSMPFGNLAELNFDGLLDPNNIGTLNVVLSCFPQVRDATIKERQEIKKLLSQRRRR